MNGLTPDITAVSVVDHGTLELTFADGLSGEVDVLDRMRGPVFEDAHSGGLCESYGRSRDWNRGLARRRRPRPRHALRARALGGLAKHTGSRVANR